ncbi:MAG: beta-lactamase family protein [Bacteroidales bacterium]|nr:beta-lactamase family protein [Bacteroidales bacterium]
MKIQTSTITILLVNLILVSCDFKTNDLENVNISPDRLTRIDTMIDGYINSGKLSGATVLISRKNQIAYLKSYGYNNIVDSIPMENNCIYGIASMTKLVTSVAALILYEKGYFRLNDKLSDYLPEFKNMKVYDDKQSGSLIKNTSPPILIKDLFRHTSGIKYGTEEYNEAGADFNKVNSLAEFVQKISTVPLYHEPGSTFDYSYSTDILGYLIEKLSGQTLREFFIDNIFVPLKMDDTDFYVPKEKKDRLATFYAYDNDTLIIKETYENSIYKELPEIFSGGGGLVSTIEDYAKFLQMLLNYGHYNNKQILSQKTVELMKTDQIETIDNKGFLSDGRGHGLGVGLIPDAGQYGELFSDGSIFWAGIRNTYFWVDYKENLFGIVMTQMTPFVYLPYMDKFRILTYQAIDD